MCLRQWRKPKAALLRVTTSVDHICITILSCKLKPRTILSAGLKSRGVIYLSMGIKDLDTLLNVQNLL